MTKTGGVGYKQLHFSRQFSIYKIQAVKDRQMKGDIHMRVTRNYMSGLLNGNSSMSGTSSLLQRALSRSSKSKRVSRNALLTNSGKNNNFYANAVKNTATTQKLYYNMKYHAGQVIDYADKLTDRSDTSLLRRRRRAATMQKLYRRSKDLSDSTIVCCKR